MQSFTGQAKRSEPPDRRQSRRHGRRRSDLPPWAIVALAALTTLETALLALLASGVGR